MKAKVFLLLGDGGYIWSMGFVAFGNRLRDMGYEVETRADSGRNLEDIQAHIIAMDHRQPVALFGYSLGGNGAAWNAYNMLRRSPEVKIDLICGWDPTVNGPPLSDFPIGRNVGRCLCFQQTTMLALTSWAFGRSVYVRAKDGPPIEVTKVWNDHFLVQFMPSLQAQAIAALEQLS